MADVRDRAAIAADYRAARDSADRITMRRHQNEEACFVLLAILERLARDPASFIHEVALKGGILMAGELRSARSSADIDATTGKGRRIDPERVVADLRHAGREFGVRLDGEPDRTAGGLIVRFRFDSLTDAGSAKLEVSVREDLVLAVRDALFDVSSLGLQAFTVPALARVELVAEKLRALVQRTQPRDLFDLHLYVAESGWYLDPIELRRATNAKLALTRRQRWRPGLWRSNLESIRATWEPTMTSWVDPALLPAIDDVIEGVGRRLKALGLD